MWRTVGWVLGGLATAGAVGWLGFLVAFRTRFAPVQDRIRRMNRRVVNPRQLETAGRPGAYASVVHHVGRTSGRDYATPVVAVPTDAGFVVALPYGPGADWVRNVIAAGGARVDHEGRHVAVARPRLVPPDEGNPHFPAKEQRMHRLYGVREFLRVDEVATRS